MGKTFADTDRLAYLESGCPARRVWNFSPINLQAARPSQEIHLCNKHLTLPKGVPPRQQGGSLLGSQLCSIPEPQRWVWAQNIIIANAKALLVLICLGIFSVLVSPAYSNSGFTLSASELSSYISAWPETPCCLELPWGSTANTQDLILTSTSTSIWPCNPSSLVKDSPPSSQLSHCFLVKRHNLIKNKKTSMFSPPPQSRECGTHLQSLFETEGKCEITLPGLPLLLITCL